MQKLILDNRFNILICLVVLLFLYLILNKEQFKGGRGLCILSGQSCNSCNLSCCSGICLNNSICK